MHARRDNPAIPAWSGDELDSFPPEIEVAYFDDALQAWVLSRHADILAAFHASSLCPASSKSTKVPEPARDALRLKMREELSEALSAAQLRAWREELASEARVIVDALPVGAPTDLIEKCARPFCIALAALVTGISRNEAEALYGIAQPLSAAAADPYDHVLHEEAKAADARLEGCFHSQHEALRGAGFVALAHTMQGILGNAWFALVEYPQQWRLLHLHPELMDQAVEELLRYAGLARILSRMATEDIDINGVTIRKGERIILRVIAGNHDPDRYPDANHLHVTRRGAGHFTLGAGSHSCVAANLIRMATVTITQLLIGRFDAASAEPEVEWRGGPVFRFPKTLRVSLTENL